MPGKRRQKSITGTRYDERVATARTGQQLLEVELDRLRAALAALAKADPDKADKARRNLAAQIAPIAAETEEAGRAARQSVR